MTTNKNTDKELPATSATKTPLSFVRWWNKYCKNTSETLWSEGLIGIANVEDAWNACEAQMREELIEAKEANKTLEDTLKKARTYKGIEGYACPLCEYKDGYFIKSCEIHSQLAQERAARTEAEAKCAEMREVISNGHESHCYVITGKGLGCDCGQDIKEQAALSTSCGKGWASPELVKEAIEALEQLMGEFEDVMYSEFQTTNNPNPELGHAGYLQAKKVLAALACLNQKEKDAK